MHQHATPWPGCTCPQKQHADAPGMTTCAVLGLAAQELAARQRQHWQHCAFMFNCSVALASTHILCAPVAAGTCGRSKAAAATFSPAPEDALGRPCARGCPVACARPQQASEGVPAAQPGQSGDIMRRKLAPFMLRMCKRDWRKARAQPPWRDSTHRRRHRPYHDAPRTLAGGHAPPHRRHVHGPAEEGPPEGTACRHAASWQERLEW